MANTFKALRSKPFKIDQPPRPILMCPFCDATFNNETLWRTHARNHWTKQTANQSTQTCDMEFVTSTTVDLLNIKSEVPERFDTMYNPFDDFGHFISLSTTPSDIKLEPSVQITTQDQIVNMKQEIVQDCKEVTIKPRRSKKPAVCANAKFSFPTEPVNCALCNEIISNLFPTAKEITEEFKHSNQFECRLCGVSIERLSSVPIHYSRVHINKDGKLNSMAACNACVSKKAKGQKLQFANSDPTWIKCELCLRLNRNHTSYQNHLRNFHKDRCVHSCAPCDRLFIGRSQYKKHVYTKHSGKFKPRHYDKEYHCDRCGKVFRQRPSIISHLHAHFSPKRFHCTLCPVTVKTAVNMANHMRIHSGLKNVTCDVCGRRFVDKSNLMAHMLSHTGEQPWPCKECGKRFSKKSNMTKHLRTHTGEKVLSRCFHISISLI